MDQGQGCGPVLFLWQSESAVVMGKNQNPWRECRLDRMEADGVPLARRISGGGTVYHDVGNLNYCVIVDREAYQEEWAYEMVFQSLETFGIRAEKSGKSNLSVEGRKFSGNAFAFRKGRAMHHGTLLLHTDLKRLGHYLGSMIDGIETRAIASVPAHVMNLELGVEELSTALKTSFKARYGAGDETILWQEEQLDEVALQPLLHRQVSNNWKWGATPKFSVAHQGTQFEVVKGVVVSAEGNEVERLVGQLFSVELLADA